MVKLLKQSSISFALRNTRGQRVDYKGTTNEPGQRHSNKNIKPDRMKDNIFLKTERPERMASGWMTAAF